LVEQRIRKNQHREIPRILRTLSEANSLILRDPIDSPQFLHIDVMHQELHQRLSEK